MVRSIFGLHKISRMNKLVAAVALLVTPALSALAQDKLTPEKLIGLKRVVGEAVSPSGKTLYYSVRQVNLFTEKSTTKRYKMNLPSGEISEWTPGAGKTIVQRNGSQMYAMEDGALFFTADGDTWDKQADLPEGADNIRVSPDGNYIAFSREVLVQKVLGTDRHPDLPKTSALVYTNLNFRHWDTWEDGKYSHIFVMPVGGTAKDIMEGEPYDAPQKPFGGADDIVWQPNSKGLVYVCKKKWGKEYAISTNTDLYYYDLGTGKTENWTEGMMGYDTNPVFSEDGTKLAWLSQERDGFESDKNRLMVSDVPTRSEQRPPRYMTQAWDETVSSFVWDKGGSRILFNAPWRGTEQLFEVKVPANLTVRSIDAVRQITNGKWDVSGLIGQSSANEIIVARTDHNHAAELYRVNLQNGEMRQLTRENEAAYDRIRPSRSELRLVTTTDGKKMGVWVVYPPDFDSTKKYPALLYCQGGPQSALTQFFSYRWNFALMAAQGYIVVAPNRRGMPGWGTQWNESISRDWGGQPIRDYISAIDAVAAEKYVDRNRLGCVGASYGGYSVYMLAGMHGGRFKSFIAHDGLFDLKSWYGTTEELWFANFDVGGPYWGKNPSPSYARFNPSNFVDKWDAPIMVVQGGTDYRVGIEQGLAAFSAAQMRGIKSKLLYLPDENHWVLRPQNSVVWQREFFGWLEETLGRGAAGGAVR